MGVRATIVEYNYFSRSNILLFWMDHDDTGLKIYDEGVERPREAGEKDGCCGGACY